MKSSVHVNMSIITFALLLGTMWQPTQAASRGSNGKMGMGMGMGMGKMKMMGMGKMKMSGSKGGVGSKKGGGGSKKGGKSCPCFTAEEFSDTVNYAQVGEDDNFCYPKACTINNDPDFVDISTGCNEGGCSGYNCGCSGYGYGCDHPGAPDKLSCDFRPDYFYVHFDDITAAENEACQAIIINEMFDCVTSTPAPSPSHGLTPTRRPVDVEFPEDIDPPDSPDAIP
jgi:hypothetical protein